MMERLFAGLQGRVLLAMLLLAMGPLLIVAYQGHHCARQAIEDLARFHLVSVAESRKDTIEAWYTGCAADIQLVASAPALSELVLAPDGGKRSDTMETLNKYLTVVQARQESFEKLSIYDADWQLLTSTNTGPHQTMSILSDDLKVRAEASQGLVLGTAHVHDRRAVGIHFIQPLLDAAGSTGGYLVANLNLTTTLTPRLQEREGLMESGKVYVVAGNAQIITEPFPGEGAVAFETLLPPEVLFQMADPQSNVREYQDYAGVKVLGTALHLPIADWFLVTEIDRREALGWLDVLVFRTSLTVAVTLGAVLAASMWLSGLLGKPLQQLAAIAYRVRTGQIEERVPPSRYLEANEVGQAFNQMLDELRDQQEVIVRTATLASMGELTSSIVHEMRNPLSSIKMNLQALSRDMGASDPNYELAEIAAAQIQRMENMLTDLLQFGRPIGIVKESVLFDELARTTLEAAQEIMDKKCIICKVINQLNGHTLFVDREQMYRALSNLIINAVQASAPGASVEVIARKGDTDRPTVEIEVMDSGPGLNPTAQKKLFQPFFTTKPGGTGLGLANVKKIAELHGGNITAENRPEGGAVFSLSLPQENRAAEFASSTGSEDLR
ncbi:MAG: HAMP domain-containing protein [Candidatus Hydrogenedentes bacterium]|nr:HAMP domain-containing protein [Candidatus Hydrogenedentota bacterium]